MDRRSELVRIDDAGVARPIGRLASQRLTARRGDFRMMPAPPHLIFMRLVAEGGDGETTQGATVRLAGEVTRPGTLCDIVALIAQAGWRGELVVLDGEAQRSIIFDAGNVVGAQSNAPGERLGEVMYKLGALSMEQVAAVMAQVTPERRFGEVAVDVGHLTTDKVYELMAKQTEEVVYASLLVGDGTFFFLDGFDEARLTTRHLISANALLMEGVRRMDEVKYFRERIPSDEHVPVPTSGRADPPAALADVYRACDGQRSVLDVGRACGRSEFEITQAIFQLVQAGLVQIQPPSPSSPEAIVAIFNDAIRATYEAMDRAGKSDLLRETLAMFSSTAGVYDALFRGAGPAADGSLSPARIAVNIVTLRVQDPVAQLAEWLYDYVAYALFNAGAVLPKSEEQALGKRVNDRVALLAPKSARSTRG